MRNNSFLTWLGQILTGTALFLGSLEIVRIFWAGTWEIEAGCAATAALGLYIIWRAEGLERPRRVLRKARRQLHFPTQWAVKFDKSVPGGGVIPVAVIRSDQVRFVIDIQGFKNARWDASTRTVQAGPMLGKPAKKPKLDPVAPLLQAAAAWNATAILWLPEADSSQNLRQEDSNLIVVMGSARDLKHVLQGAEISASRQAARAPAEPRRTPASLTLATSQV
ncbi:MAG TPA: hypothetical protein VE029_00375 [Rhizobacter sp.]|nr:hypothetical protein [Rhizobacter sp.]